MAKATEAEVEQRIEEIMPFVVDCFTPREIRAITQAKTAWGATISEVQLKRYIASARKRIRAQAVIDHSYELAAAKLRNERTLARASVKGDLRTYAAVNRQQCGLLGLAAPTPVDLGGIDIDALRQQLAENIAAEMAAHENETKEHHGNASTDK